MNVPGHLTDRCHRLLRRVLPRLRLDHRPSRNSSSSTRRTASLAAVDQAAAYVRPHGFRLGRILAIAIIAWPALLLAHPGHGVALFAFAATPLGPRPAVRVATAPPRTDAISSRAANISATPSGRYGYHACRADGVSLLQVANSSTRFAVVVE